MESYFNLGSHSRLITTASEDAQLWFNRGLNWLYGFNHSESVACFQRAAVCDPACAMAHWGIALATGPYINKQWSYYSERELHETLDVCYHMARRAQRLGAHGTPSERGLLAALVERYQSPESQELTALARWNDDYAHAMRKVYAQFSSDLDVVALFAEAMMNRTPWRLWDLESGEPFDHADTLEMMVVLEKGMAQSAHPHPGILHMYIHTMEMSPMPQRALRAADQLRSLAPEGGHLLHMPSHIYMQCGHYYDALAVSYNATAADRKYIAYANLGRDDRYLSACCHNFHQLMTAATYLGQYEAALYAANAVQRLLTEDILRTEIPQLARTLEAHYSMKSHVLVRFGKWKEIIEEPLPEDDQLYCVTTAMMRYARGVAYAALGQHDAADIERAQFYAALENVPADRLIMNNQAHAILGVATEMLNGEVEYHRGNYDVAFQHLRQAVVNDDALNYSEPWSWMHPPRHALGALLLAQGYVDEAEQVYRADLGLDGVLIWAKRHLNNVWSLHGLAECLRGKGKAAELALVEPQLELAMSRTDQPITSSCHCRVAAHCCH
jgi:tetratricopeptide (TPR) repeat protein